MTRQERFEAATTPLRPGVTALEASAGTGKTFAVSALFLRYLLEQEKSVDQILVVTFTRAATASLRQRIRTMLADGARWVGDAIAGRPSAGGDADWLKDLPRPGGDGLKRWAVALQTALDGFDAAAVFTIDGFCQRVLSEFALASGLPFETEVVEGMPEEIEREADDFWRRLFLGPAGDVRAELASLAGLTPDLLARLGAESLQPAEIRITPAWDERAKARRGELEANRGEAAEDRKARAEEWAVGVRAEFLTDLRKRLEKGRAGRRTLTFDDLRQLLGAALCGAGGARLSERLRARHHVALIDEFQDTDSIQWGIFRRLFVEGAPEHHLWLVGDPKQAIYSFRGADVFTYLAARDSAARRLTLGDNWRSEAPLVAGVNQVFQRGERPFLLKRIQFEPAASRGRAEATPLLEAGERRPSLQFLYWAPGPDLTKKDDQQRFVAARVAEEIRSLIGAGAFRSSEGRVPLQARDVAVLVASHQEALHMEGALARCGLASVRQTQDSVFEAPAADFVRRVLRAAADPTDEAALRSAAATPLLGWTATELAGIEAQGGRWSELAGRFHGYAARWDRDGVLAMWRTLLAGEGAAARLLPLPHGLRDWVDAGHLAELAEQAAVEGRLGRPALADWFERRIASTDRLVGEADRLRLDRDDDAVRLVTIHASKGLEYPVVYCPFLFEPAVGAFRGGRLAPFHDPEAPGIVSVDLRGKKLPDGSPAPSWLAAQEEQFAERLRLAYVALTRAKHRCSVVWGPVVRRADGYERSTLAWLLHPPSIEGLAPGGALARLKETLKPAKKKGAPDLRAGLKAFAAGAGAEVRDLGLTPPGGPGAAIAAEPSQPPPLVARVLRRPIPSGDVVTSYSALIGEHRVEARPDAAAEPLPDPPAEAGPGGALEGFGGVEAGNCLHAIFEAYPLLADPAAELEAVAARELTARGFDATELTGPVAELAALTVAQPLPLGGGLSVPLASVPRTSWRSEAGFHLPVGELSPERLQLAAGAGGVRGGWIEDLGSLGFSRLHGYLTGRIDLIFPCAGRYWIVDWKSNRLASYDTPGMAAEMRSAQYYLQAHLYALALHRRLRRRLSDYSYERHFGGVFYLFVRGVDGTRDAAGNARGVFVLRPPIEVMDAMERQLLADAAAP